MISKEDCKKKGGDFLKGICEIRLEDTDSSVPSKKFQMGHTLTFTILFGLIFIAIVVGPIFPVWLVIPLAVILFFILKHYNIVKPFKKIDLILIPSIMIGYVFLGVILGVWAIATIPWWKIILTGVVADLISVGAGFLESAGYVSGVVPGIMVGLISAIVVWVLVSSIVGGFFGLILAMIAGLIILLPGPWPLVTISFIIIKLIVLLLI